MKQLLDQIIEATYKANAFFSKRPIRPTPGPPATAADLRRLDAHLASKGFQAPVSYKAALSAYNGIEHFLGRNYSLLSIDAIVGGKYEILEENEEEFPNLCGFVIAAGNTPTFMGFDTSTSPKGDGYEVSQVSDEGSEWRCKSFEAFLKQLLANLEQTIREEEADRANLKP
jgi:hypothetical protein